MPFTKNNDVAEIKLDNRDAICTKLNKLNNAIEIIDDDIQDSYSFDVSESDAKNASIKKVISLVANLEDFINAMNFKYNNMSKTISSIEKNIQQIDSNNHLINSNFKKLINVMTNYNKIIKDLEQNSKSDDTSKQVKQALDQYKISENICDIKKELERITAVTNNYAQSVEKIKNDVLSDIKASETEENKIIQLVSNYHNTIKKNISKISNDINNVMKYRESNLPHVNVLSDIIAINDLNMHNIEVNVIEYNDIIKIVGHIASKNIIIKKKTGSIDIGINAKGYSVTGKIKIINYKKDEVFKGIITNKNLDHIVYIIYGIPHIPANFSFDGHIDIKFKLIKNKNI